MNGRSVTSILFVIDSLRLGGAERSLCTLLNLLPAEKFDIEVALTARGGELERLIPGHVRLATLTTVRKGLFGRLLHNFSRLRLFLTRLITPGRHPNESFWWSFSSSIPPMREKYDIAVAYQQGFSTYYVATKVNATRKIAWINADISSVGYSEKFNLPYYRLFSKIVTVSDRLRDIVSTIYPSLAHNLLVINDILDPKLLLSLSESGNPFAETPRGTLRILTVGRLFKVKGIDMAVDAAAILRERGLDFHWTIIGDGPMRTELIKSIRNRSLESFITLEGAKANPYPYFRHCDIYVQPSRSEGYGIAICEAKIFDRPVIATDFPVAHDRIDNGSDGLICPMSPQGIADAVISLSDPKTRGDIRMKLTSVHDLTSQTELPKLLSLLTNEN